MARNWPYFFAQSSQTRSGRERKIRSCIGEVSLTSNQAKRLKVKPRTRVSPHLERCSLLLCANESFANAEVDIEVLTGVKVSHGTQHRQARQNALSLSQSQDSVREMSVDGGKVRLRTPKGQESLWRDYKAIALHGQVCAAVFQDNAQLADWVRQQPRAESVSVVADGHPGVWNLARDCLKESQRQEILDWYHLIENLHRVGGSNQRLEAVREHLWQGEVEAAGAEFGQWRTPEVVNFLNYIERHSHRLPNYAQRQENGQVIGSGEVESTIKRIGLRMKISGAQWNRENVNPMLRLRCAYLNRELA
uniref:ISKra4 family transposase n=1 Tax=Baaleninema simplex TaxID=2862350 RepID=UPI0003477135|nr:ISKra4 family transposase [Baaleninema simplex]